MKQYEIITNPEVKITLTKSDLCLIYDAFGYVTDDFYKGYSFKEVDEFGLLLNQILEEMGA